ncbi:hypothetical protein BC830DRAFT_422674 [Chytriomyces sp. MP71]|nr:hypothetical protein BC830DRAFT_422674 [Chytriomyces sp. MP71]
MAQQHPRHPFAAYFVTGRFADAVLSVRQEKDADDGDACAASVEVERVPVHRIVLAAQSSVLDALFASCASLPSAPCAAKREPTFSQPQKQDHAEGEQPSTFESASIPAVPTLSTAPEFQHIQLKPLPDSVLTPSHSYALSLPVVPLLLPNATNSQALRAVLEWAYFGRLSHASLSLGSIFELLRLAEILRVDALYVHARGWLEHLLRGSFSDNQLDAFLSQDMILGVANKEPISAMNPARLPQCPRLASEWASAVVSAVRTSTHADLLVRVLAAAVRDIKSFPEASDSSLSGQNNESFSELQQDIELVLRVSKDHSDSFITYRFVRNICTTWQDKFDDPLNADHVMTLLNLIDYEQFAVPELEVLNKDVTHDRVPKQIAFKAFMLAVKKRESSVPRNPSSSEIPVADMYLGAPGAQTGILGDHFDPLTITAAKSTLSKEKLEAQKGGCCVLSPLAISQSPATVSASTSTTSLLAFAIPEDGNETIRPDTINNPSRRAVASSSKKQRPPLSRSLFIPVHSANDVELKEFSSPTSSEPASHQTVSAMTNAPTTSRFNSAGFSSNGFSARSNLADSCNDEYVVASSFEEFRLAANVAGQAERKDQTSADGSNSNESFDQISATASSLFNSAARAIHQQFFGKTKSEEEVTAVSADTADTSKLDEDEGNLTAIYVGPRSIESGCDEFTVENVTTSEPQEAMSVAATIIPATNANSITCSAGSADNLQPKSKKGSADIELSSRASSLPAALVSSSRIYRLPVPSFSEMNSGSNHVNTSRAATLSGPVAPSQSSKPIQHSVLPQLRRHTMSVPSTTELLDAVSQKLTRLIEKGHIDVVAEVEDGRQVHDIQYSGNRSAESEKMELAPTLGALRDVTKPISVLSFNARHGIDIARTGISDSQVETVRLPIEKRWAQVSGNVEEMNHRNTVSEMNGLNVCPLAGNKRRSPSSALGKIPKEPSLTSPTSRTAPSSLGNSDSKIKPVVDQAFFHHPIELRQTTQFSLVMRLTLQFLLFVKGNSSHLRKCHAGRVSLLCRPAALLSSIRSPATLAQSLTSFPGHPLQNHNMQVEFQVSGSFRKILLFPHHRTSLTSPIPPFPLMILARAT